MFAYWLLLIALSVGSMLHQGKRGGEPSAVLAAQRPLSSDVPLLIALAAITLMIGFRDRVGGDWNVYKYWFDRLSTGTLVMDLRQSPDEIGYTCLNWLAGQVGGRIWLVNLVCAIPFVVGLSSLCRQQPNPWLALVVATPLFIIVVGMGYTRQATAVGFVLVGLSGLIRGRSYWWFVFWVLVASTFHQSALVLIPLVPLFLLRATAFSFVLLVLALGIGYYVLLPHELERYSIGYIDQVYMAKGAIYRIAPNAITGAMVLGFRRQYVAGDREVEIWRGWALLSIIAFVGFFFVQSTVILDRLSIYILPLQIWAWSRLPTAFGERHEPNIILTMLVIAYSALVLGLWLSFANNSGYWLPYRMYQLA